MIGKNKTYHLIIVLLVVLFGAGIIYCGYVVNQSDQKGYIENHEKENNEEDPTSKELTGVVRAVDAEAKVITIGDIQSDTIVKLSYNGGTKVLNRFDEDVTMSKMIVGTIVDVKYNSNFNKLYQIQDSKDAWTYKNVDKMKVQREKNIITLGESNYGYKDDLVVVSDNEIISFLEVLSKDQLDIRGIDDQIYSIVVTKGHGYIRFTGYDAFVGGSVSIGVGTYLPVTENMNVVMREGTYKLKMVNGELIGTKNVAVARDQEVTVDMSEFKISNDRVGEVTFYISPDGADLNLNGGNVDYSKPIKLNYGEHKIIVSLDGYKDFAGILTVAQAKQEININLVPDTSEDESTGDDDVDKIDKDDITLDWDSDKTDETKPLSSPSTEPDSEDMESDDEKEDDKKDEAIKVDKAHKITVQSPDGVEVYFNDMYKGIAPVSFSKIIGRGTISLKKEGYVTKSYDVDVVDDEEDVFFKFQALKEAE